MFSNILSNSSQSLSSFSANSISSSTVGYGALSDISDKSSLKSLSNSLIFYFTMSLVGLLSFFSFHNSFHYVGGLGTSTTAGAFGSNTTTPKSFFLDHYLRAFLATSLHSDFAGQMSLRFDWGQISG